MRQIKIYLIIRIKPSDAATQKGDGGSVLIRGFGLEYFHAVEPNRDWPIVNELD